MTTEHDCVVLTQDLAEASLKAGDVPVVHVHQGGAGYEVEFMTLAPSPIRYFRARQ